jgi:hypothetical protein
VAGAGRGLPRTGSLPETMTPEEVVQLIIDKMEEGDPEVLSRISLVMKNRVLQKKEDLREIEAILLAQVPRT